MTVRRAFITLGFVGLAVAICLLLTGPRMKEQANVRAYDEPMRLPPAGVVPVSAPAAPAIPTAEEAVGLKSPIEPTTENVARGSVYYRYYCLACHGERGDGNGPVAPSYLPDVADLRAPKVQRQTDGQLYRAILAGAGHAPVLEYTIPPEHRWPIVLYLRTFVAPTPGPDTAAK